MPANGVGTRVTGEGTLPAEQHNAQGVVRFVVIDFGVLATEPEPREKAADGTKQGLEAERSTVLFFVVHLIPLEKPP
jgi:hypothetical protein